MNENLLNGIVLLCMGMGVVLCFLVTMILSMQFMTFIVGQLNKIFPETSVEIKSAAKKIETTADEAIAVALAAVKVKRS